LDIPLPTLVSHRLRTASNSSAGVMFAIGSYLWWAFVTPLYFKFLAEIPVVELLIWRIISALPLLVGLLLFRKKLVSAFKALRNRKTLFLLIGSTFFISINWVVFILAVVWDRLTEGSLGYYINPLVTVALGFVILGERLRILQVIAVFIALGGVIYLTIAQGSLPWISMLLAGSFAMYGLLRKLVNVGSIEGLTIEMTFVFPLCIGIHCWLASNHESVLVNGPWIPRVGLLLGGFITIVPLLLFASGNKRLPLSTMGILQYIAPTGQLLLATIWFGEPFGMHQIIVFGLIWTAILLYSFDSWRNKD
jgi:chloramphenicol-sensitive protein RarD